MANVPRSADYLVDEILSPGVLDAVVKDPEKTLRALAAVATKNLPPPVAVTNAGIYYVVVISLGAVAVLAMFGALYLTATNKATTVQIPDIMTALGSAAIGALAGLLAPSPTGK
jgi:hypothetical protein